MSLTFLFTERITWRTFLNNKRSQGALQETTVALFWKHNFTQRIAQVICCSMVIVMSTTLSSKLQLLSIEIESVRALKFNEIVLQPTIRHKATVLLSNPEVLIG